MWKESHDETNVDLNLDVLCPPSCPHRFYEQEQISLSAKSPQFLTSPWKVDRRITESNIYMEASGMTADPEQVLMKREFPFLVPMAK